MEQARASYDCYKQMWEESRIEILYDEDERPMTIRTKDIGDPLSWDKWLPGELEWAIEEEEYLYAAELRDELLKIKTNTNEPTRRRKTINR